jgi:hypothetical protein
MTRCGKVLTSGFETGERVLIWALGGEMIAFAKTTNNLSCTSLCQFSFDILLGRYLRLRGLP